MNVGSTVWHRRDIDLRDWDDMAKDPNDPGMSVEEIAKIIVRVLKTTSASIRSHATFN